MAAASKIENNGEEIISEEEGNKREIISINIENNGVENEI